MFLNFETFEEFLEYNTEGKSKRFSSYCGIIRKDYPKWRGWKVIKELNDPEVQCANLDLLVVNFYYIKYLELKELNDSFNDVS